MKNRDGFNEVKPDGAAVFGNNSWLVGWLVGWLFEVVGPGSFPNHFFGDLFRRYVLG